MEEIKLPLWSVGLVSSILGPIANAIANNGSPDWSYIFFFLGGIWFLIGLGYLITWFIER